MSTLYIRDDILISVLRRNFLNTSSSATTGPIHIESRDEFAVSYTTSAQDEAESADSNFESPSDSDSNLFVGRLRSQQLAYEADEDGKEFDISLISDTRPPAPAACRVEMLGENVEVIGDGLKDEEDDDDNWVPGSYLPSLTSSVLDDEDEGLEEWEINEEETCFLTSTHPIEDGSCSQSVSDASSGGWMLWTIPEEDEDCLEEL